MFLNLNRLFIYLFTFIFFFRNELAKLATKGELLVAKVEVSCIVTVLISISSPVK